MQTKTLPQLDQTYLSEGGLETDLIFHHGIDLPYFASFPLIDSDDGRAVLRDYYAKVINLARRRGTGAVLETPTWRASSDWGELLGYSPDALDAVNRGAVELFQSFRNTHPDVDIVISGNLGPRGDGYVVGEAMTSAQAAAYHAPQLRSFAAASADMATVLTITYAAEATGIVQAASDAGLPVVVSFTVETDGRLPSGQTLADAIDEVDAASDSTAAYFMVNCAHPSHFAHVFDEAGPWHRIRGIRANASTMSHAELDDATELDRGDIEELARGYDALASKLPPMAVIGGCCGTDLEHLDLISSAVLTAEIAAPR